MSTLHFQPQHYFNTIGSHEPVLKIQDGDTVVTSTIDARGQDQSGNAVANRGNPMTGPFFVEGAMPGDMLEVRFDDIAPNRSWGWTSNVVASNVVDPAAAAQLPQSEVVRWQVSTTEGWVRLEEPTPLLSSFTLPTSPFLGCFGVAPSRGQAISTATSGEHGGNMDYRGFLVGVQIYFPVFTEGALLYMGDGHAVQGDGEIVGTGVEISMNVRFTVKVHKGKNIRWPRGETETHIFTVGNARPLDQALQHATTEMLSWLREDYGFSEVEASLLLGQTVEYDLGNVFNPAYTMVCKLRKDYLTGLGETIKSI